MSSPTSSNPEQGASASRHGVGDAGDGRTAVARAFLDLYLADKAAGVVRSLGDYIALFPGDRGGVAADYLGLEAGLSETASELPDSDTLGGAALWAAFAQTHPLFAGHEGSDARLSPDRVGPYKLIKELGRGGQGMVHLAEDTRLGRRVALKVLTGWGAASDQVVERFRREAAIASRLDHPGICTVYETGTAQGIPYMAMRHVEGESLSNKITRASTDAAGDEPSFVDLEEVRPDTEADPAPSGASDQVTQVEVAAITGFIESTARALHAAHEAGVIHRDMKPGNIMITPEGDPVLLDFGLARDSDGDQPTVTQTGELFGTPAYMAPEQLMAQRMQVDRRADVWALGVTLYECLCLKRPFEAPTRDGLYQQILHKDPPDVRKLNPSIPNDLAVIVQTATEKDRDRRYQTALDLAEDLRRFRTLKPIHAKPVGPATRLIRWTQRNPAVATLTAALFCSMATGLVWIWSQKAELTRSNVRLETKTAEAENNAGRARDSLTEWERLADGRRLEDLLSEAEGEGWPILPSKIAAYEAWLTRARALTAKRAEHEAALAMLREHGSHDPEADRSWFASEHQRFAIVEGDLAVARAVEKTAATEKAAVRARSKIRSLVAESDRLWRVTSVRRCWRFRDEGSQLRHDKLRDLVAGLAALVAEPTGKAVTVAVVEQRLASAAELRRRLAQDDAVAWQRCLADLARPEAPYHDLSFDPIPGLVPLGRDRDSNLWEFWHVASGGRPEWEGQPLGPGKVKLHPDSGAEGMVMVLIPAGTFRMGAIKENPDHPAGSPGVDDLAFSDEGPAQDVTLDAYLIGKYEVTQGQWTRLFGENQTHYRAGTTHRGKPVTLRMPVANVSWDQCREACRRWDLSLPTEARWERACRGGAGTRFCTGDDVDSLRGFANIGSVLRSGDGASSGSVEPNFVDGYALASAVGVLEPNPFGLHDVHGNVNEWCLDGFGSYNDRRSRAGDGLRTPRRGARHCVYRGGSFGHNARRARSTYRGQFDPGNAGNALGLRPARRVTRF